jgi:hypothetical protein
MNTDHLTRLLQRFAAAVEAHSRALEEMDEDGANRHATVVCRLQESIMRDPGGVEGFVSLLGHGRPEVRGMAALQLLPLHPDPALEVLRQLAVLPGLMGFRASVALERWEKGEGGGGHGP